MLVPCHEMQANWCFSKNADHEGLAFLAHIRKNVGRVFSGFAAPGCRLNPGGGFARLARPAWKALRGPSPPARRAARNSSQPAPAPSSASQAGEGLMFPGVPSISILSRDPDLSTKPPETQADFFQGGVLSTKPPWKPRENGRFLERTMVEKNGESTPEL